jgi:hypothetical protein
MSQASETLRLELLNVKFTYEAVRDEVFTKKLITKTVLTTTQADQPQEIDYLKLQN